MTTTDNAKRVVDYFLVVGLAEEAHEQQPYPDISVDAIKANYTCEPIVELAVIDRTLNEQVPLGYECLWTTPAGHSANLNHGSLRCHELYLCFRRGRHRPPITDIGVLYEGKESLLPGCHVIKETFYGASANVNNSSLSGNRIFITYRRATEHACNSLAAIDLCVIIKSKGENAPHSFNEIKSSLNKGILGSTVYLCYKKALIAAPQLKYLPSVLFRYPTGDVAQVPLSGVKVANFGLPMGAMIELWPNGSVQPAPFFSTFVLSSGLEGSAQVTKVYAASITFYERYDEAKLSESQRMQLMAMAGKERERPLENLYSNKCLILMSRYPFFDAFGKFLYFLYRQTQPGSPVSRIPVERYIEQFFNAIPFPSAQKPRTCLHLPNGNDVSIYLPEESILPQSGASFIELLRNLQTDNCIQLLILVLLEKKIMVHSLRPAVLTGVAEALTDIIFPFIWRYPYIPMCPLNMSLVLENPIPFIYGMDSRYFDMFDAPDNVICVDLDTNTISMSDERKNLNPKILPRKPLYVLRNRLKDLENDIELLGKLKRQASQNNKFADDHEIKIKKKEKSIEIAIREAFLRFMAAILHNYNKFRRISTRNPEQKAKDRNISAFFACEDFVASKESSCSFFYRELIKNQLFNDFIISISFSSEEDSSLADALEHFDACCLKVNPNADKDDTRYLDFNSSLNDRTSVVLALEPHSESDEFTYNGFPKLNIDLFGVPSVNIDSNFLTTNQNPLQTPSTPIGVRTKAEIFKSHRKFMLNDPHRRTSPENWAYCLLSNTYAIWFIYLPCYVHSLESKVSGLNYAYTVLVNMQKQLLKQPDEICYRVFMQLCLLYKLPTLAVKLFLHMRKYSININPTTVSYYNKVLMEGVWPSRERDRWGKLRSMMRTMRAFKYNLELKEQREAAERLAAHKARKSASKRNRSSLKTPRGADDSMTKQGKLAANNSCSSQSQSITNSMSSIADPDKYSVDKMSRESIDSGAYLNGGDNSSARNTSLPQTIEFFNGASIDFDVRTVTNTVGTKVETSDTLVEATAKKLQRQMSKAKDESLIKKNTLRFEQKLKSKTLIVRKNRKQTPSHAHYDHYFVNGIGIVMTCGEDQNSIFSQQGAKKLQLTDSIFFGMRKHNSDESIFMKNLNRLMDNYTSVDESRKNSTLKAETQAAPAVIIDPLGAYLANSPQVATTDPLSDFTTPIRNPQSGNSSAFLSNEDRQKEISEVRRKLTECRLFENYKDESGAGDYVEPKVEPKPQLNKSSLNDEYESDGDVDDEDSDEDDEDEDEDEEETDESFEESGNTSGISFTTPKILGSLFNRVTDSIKNNQKLESVTKFTAQKLTDLTTSLQSRYNELPASLNKQELKQKFKSLSIHSNLISAFSQSNSNPASAQMQSSTSFHGKLNSADSVSSINSFDDWEMPESYEPDVDIFAKNEQHDAIKSLQDILINIQLTSCNRCKCNKFLYDEEIMSLWSWNDSDLNIRCPYCKQSLVPHLYIKTKDDCEKFLISTANRNSDNAAQNDNVSNARRLSVVDKKLNTLSVPYLSPLVLRKELENVINHEPLVINTAFMENHSVIFWNLIWYFRRIDVDSELPLILLNSKRAQKSSINGEEMEKEPVSDFIFDKRDKYRVQINCMWDDLSYSTLEYAPEPLYECWIKSIRNTLLLNSSNDYRTSFRQTNPRTLKKLTMDVTQSIKSNDMATPFRNLLKERDYSKPNYLSVYREILFLSVIVLKRECIDIDAFDREYRSAYKQLSAKLQSLLTPIDKPPNNAAVWCRRLFSPLNL